MFVTIFPPMSPSEEPVNEFTSIQQKLDRASWQGTGCVPCQFEKDEYASFSNEERGEKK